MVRSVWLHDRWRGFVNITIKHAVCGRRARLGETSSLRRDVARGRIRTSCWAVAAAVLCAASVAGAKTTSLDREVKATPGREVRVGIYTSMRLDCMAGSLPAIRLSVAPEHGAVTVRRAAANRSNGFTSSFPPARTKDSGFRAER